MSLPNVFFIDLFHILKSLVFGLNKCLFYLFIYFERIIILLFAFNNLHANVILDYVNLGESLNYVVEEIVFKPVVCHNVQFHKEVFLKVLVVFV